MHGESGGLGSPGVRGRDAVVTGLAMETMKIEMKWGVKRTKSVSVQICIGSNVCGCVWVIPSSLEKESPRKNAGWIGE